MNDPKFSSEEDDPDDPFAAFAEAVEKQDVEKEAEAALEVWEYMARQKEESSPWLISMGEAHECEAAFDWSGAKAAYQRAIEGATDRPMLQSKAYGQLSSLYRLLNENQLAWEATKLATKAARRGGIPVWLVENLQVEVGFHLRAKELDLAWEKLQESFSLIDPGPVGHTTRASALVLRASCFLAEENLSEAERDLDEAWKLLEPRSEIHFFAGPQGGIASWWSVKARLHSAREEWEQAAKTSEEVVVRRRIISQLPQLEGPYKHNSLAVALRDLYRARLRAGDGSADIAIQECHAIRQRIGLHSLEE